MWTSFGCVCLLVVLADSVAINRLSRALTKELPAETCTAPTLCGEVRLNTHAESPDPLAAHKDALSTGNNLVIRYNNINDDTAAVDFVLHLHGFTSNRGEAATNSKLAISGLVLSDRRGKRPTIAVMPRGKWLTGSSYDFPALTAAGGLDTFIQYSLAAFTRLVPQLNGKTVTRSRLLLTAHSGGGKALYELLNVHQDKVHEVHGFDCSYWATGPMLRWMLHRIKTDGDELKKRTTVADRLAYMEQDGGAGRNFYRPGTKTEAQSKALDATFNSAKPVGLAPWYRNTPTPTAHDDIPKNFGPLMLHDPNDVPVLPVDGGGTTPGTPQQLQLPVPSPLQQPSSSDSGSTVGKLSDCNAGTPGFCIDRSQHSCSVPLLKGQCAGAATVMCCQGSSQVLSKEGRVSDCKAGTWGHCIDTTKNSCMIEPLTGACAGNAFVRCCQSSSGPLGGTTSPAQPEPEPGPEPQYPQPQPDIAPPQPDNTVPAGAPSCTDAGVCTCPSGGPLKQRLPPDTPNGCGPKGDGFYFEVVDDLSQWLATGQWDFNPVCTDHDNCYSKCGSVRNQCDQALENGLQALCIRQFSDWTQVLTLAECKSKAWIMATAVKKGGGKQFKRVQTNTCGC